MEAARGMSQDQLRARISAAHLPDLTLVFRVRHGAIAHHVQRDDQPALVGQLPGPFRQVTLDGRIPGGFLGAVGVIALEAGDLWVLQVLYHLLDRIARVDHDQSPALRGFLQLADNEIVAVVSRGLHPGREEQPAGQSAPAHLPAQVFTPDFHGDLGRALREHAGPGQNQIIDAVCMRMGVEYLVRQEPLEVLRDLLVQLGERPILGHGWLLPPFRLCG